MCGKMILEAQFTGGLPFDIMGSEFFTYALPWLLTFAIVYGFLQHYEIPKSKEARGVISVVLAFFVMPVAQPVMAFLQSIGASLIVIVTGIIFFLVLVELAGTKRGAHEGEEHLRGGISKQRLEQEEQEKEGPEPIVRSHPKAFGTIVLVILVVIFWGAGGWEMLGISGITPPINMTTLFFLVMLALALWWMVSEED